MREETMRVVAPGDKRRQDTGHQWGAEEEIRGYNMREEVIGGERRRYKREKRLHEKREDIIREEMHLTLRHMGITVLETEESTYLVRVWDSPQLRETHRSDLRASKFDLFTDIIQR